MGTPNPIMEILTLSRKRKLVNLLKCIIFVLFKIQYQERKKNRLNYLFGICKLFFQCILIDIKLLMDLFKLLHSLLFHFHSIFLLFCAKNIVLLQFHSQLAFFGERGLRIIKSIVVVTHIQL